MARQQRKVAVEPAGSKPEPLNWVEIDGEETRTYVFPGECEVTVVGVNRLCVRPSGNHRLETASGEKWIVAAGWIAIRSRASHWSA